MKWNIWHPSWKDVAKNSKKCLWKGEFWSTAGWEGISFNLTTKQSPVPFLPLVDSSSSFKHTSKSLCTYPPSNRSKLSPSLSCDSSAFSLCSGFSKAILAWLGVFASASPSRRGNGVLFLLDPPILLSIFEEKDNSSLHLLNPIALQPPLCTL